MLALKLVSLDAHRYSRLVPFGSLCFGTRGIELRLCS